MAPPDPGAAFIGATSPWDRERSRRVLIGRGKAGLPTLLAALGDPRPAIREAALLGLRGSEGPESLEAIAAAIGDPAPQVAAAALLTLAERTLAEVPDAVLKASRHPEWSVRRAAARCLSTTTDPRAVATLRLLRQDVDPDVRRAAIDAIAVSNAPGIPAAVAADLTELGAVHGAALVARIPIYALGRASAPTLLRILELGAGIERGRRAQAAVQAGSDREDEDPNLVSEGRPGDGGEHAAEGPRRQAPEERATDEPSATTMLTAAARAGQYFAESGRSEIVQTFSDFLVRAAADSDPAIRIPAIAALARFPETAAGHILQILPTTDGPEAESIAKLLVQLRGPDARGDLLALARGERGATDSAVAGAVSALRWFKTPETTEDLAWIYSTDLPRRTRDELCAAFEDLPRSVGARSGLLSVLRDDDSSLRLRAFRLLLLYGASTEDEIEWLLGRIAEERIHWVRQRMSRLLAAHASGDGARNFAARLVRQLADDATRDDAIDALENLPEGRLKTDVANAILDRSLETDTRLIRLFTRLDGDRADAFVAGEFRAAISRGDDSTARSVLSTLRHGGGKKTLAAARDALVGGDERVAEEALRMLLLRGDEVALATLQDLYPRLDADERSDLIAMIRFQSPEQATQFLGPLLGTEQEMQAAETLLERVAEMRCPLADAVLERITPANPFPVRLRAIEALGVLGGEDARVTLRRLFAETSARADELVGSDGTDDVSLLMECTLRAAARAGVHDLAPDLARLLFHRLPQMESKQQDPDAAFSFEATVSQAILDLARVSENPRSVSAAVEEELDRLSESGDLFLLPKALFFRLAKAWAAAPAEFLPLRAECHRLTLLLPPYPDRRELLTAILLSEIAADEKDHATAAHYLEYALVLIDLHGIDGPRILKEHYGAPDPVLGLDPMARLRAEVELARARQYLVVDAPRAMLHYARAADIRPFDAWMHLGIAGEVLAAEIHGDRVRVLTDRAIAEAPFDGELLIRAARIFSELGEAGRFNDAMKRHRALVACGLLADQPIHRIGAAEGLARLGRTSEAEAELRAALALDSGSRRWIEDDPILSPLLDTLLDGMDRK